MKKKLPREAIEGLMRVWVQILNEKETRPGVTWVWKEKR